MRKAIKFDSLVLPENILRCMSPEDRKKLGKAGLTADEALAKAKVRSERQLQGMIYNLLRYRGIQPLWHRTDKRSAATVGWPDLTFAVARKPGVGWVGTIIAVAWEIKLPGEPLSSAQEQMFAQLRTSPNGWHLSVVHSVDEALQELRILGVEEPAFGLKGTP